MLLSRFHCTIYLSHETLHAQNLIVQQMIYYMYHELWALNFKVSHIYKKIAPMKIAHYRTSGNFCIRYISREKFSSKIISQTEMFAKIF